MLLGLAASGVAAQSDSTDRASLSDLNAAARVEVSGLSGQLNIRSDASLDATVVGRESVGTILQNLGCRETPERVWCEVARSQDADVRGWAAGEYLVPVTPLSLAESETFDRIGRLDCRIEGEAQTTCEFGAVRDQDGAVAVRVYVAAGQDVILLWDGQTLSLADEAGTAPLETVISGEDLTVELGENTLVVPGSVLR